MLRRVNRRLEYQALDDWELDAVDGSHHLHDARSVRFVAQLGLSMVPGAQGHRTLRLLGHLPGEGVRNQ